MTDAATLMEEARRRTGLSDFGEDSFRTGLERLVAALETEAKLNDAGRQALFGGVSQTLANRLQIEDWYARHPEIDEQEVEAPLFGIGLPRTGSTALVGLLAEDPDIRYLRKWESKSPTPPPDIATAADDPRIAREQASWTAQFDRFPAFRTMIPLDKVDDPHECLDLLALNFQVYLQTAMAFIPSYDDWFFECDARPAYAYHRRVLKLLQWRHPPNRWRLKTPAHMFHLDALIKAYPDARFVMTHRDPAASVVSVASLTAGWRNVFSDQVDRSAIGPACATAWRIALQRTVAFRDAHPRVPFHDMSHAALMKDPIGTVEALYAELRETFTPVFAQRLRNWIASHPREAQGHHRYTADEFGFTTEAVRETFAFYSDRFKNVFKPNAPLMEAVS